MRRIGMSESQPIDRKSQDISILVQIDTNQILTVPETAKLLCIGKNQAYDLVKTGRLTAIKLGKKLVVTKSAPIDFCHDERNFLDKIDHKGILMKKIRPLHRCKRRKYAVVRAYGADGEI